MEAFLALLFVIVTLLLIWFIHHQSYWQRRGVPHNAPTLLMGNMDKWGKKLHIAQIFQEIYKKFKRSGPFAGFYFFMIRSAIILDIDLVRKILIKDFHNFCDRGIFYNERDDPLTANIFFLDGEKWRKLRHKMTSTFTTCKMKFMFPTVAEVGEELATVITENLNGSGKVLEIIDFLGRYSADVIGSCAFGLECNSLRDPDAQFVAMGKQFFLERRHNKMIDGLIHSFPDMARKMRMRIITNVVHDFYMRIVRETIEYRVKNNIKRNDFMDQLIEMKNNKVFKNEYGGAEAALTIDEITAQAFVFFIAGFETSSATMGFALYELAQQPQIQDKVRMEINEVLQRHQGAFTFDSMKEMEYLEHVIDETLRLHPVVPNIMRRTRKRYETNHPKYFLEKDTTVFIPTYAIHYDPEFYPDPHTFRPERFTPEEVQRRPSCTWLPFGAGPRNCIGLRFGKMQTSIGLVYLLKNFKFNIAPETEIPYKFIKKSFLISAENGIHLKVEPV